MSTATVFCDYPLFQEGESKREHHIPSRQKDLFLLRSCPPVVCVCVCVRVCVFYRGESHPPKDGKESVTPPAEDSLE